MCVNNLRSDRFGFDRFWVVVVVGSGSGSFTASHHCWTLCQTLCTRHKTIYKKKRRDYIVTSPTVPNTKMYCNGFFSCPLLGVNCSVKLCVLLLFKLNYFMEISIFFGQDNKEQWIKKYIYKGKIKFHTWRRLTNNQYMEKKKLRLTTLYQR